MTDRGPGVPVSDRERVLGRFVRLEASRSEPGSGLGIEPCRGRGAAAWWQPETRGQRARAQSHPRFADGRRGARSTGRRPAGPREQRSGRRDGVLRAHRRAPARSTTRRAAPTRCESLTKAFRRRGRARPGGAASRRVAKGPRLAGRRRFPASPYLAALALARSRAISPSACCAIPTRIWPKRSAGLARCCRPGRKAQGGHGAVAAVQAAHGAA